MFRLSILVFATALAVKVKHELGDPLPSFGDPIQNITVIKGRDITFTCIVKHLGQYKVGWVKADTKAIQAIHHQVVTHNPRVSVTYRDKTTWNLHIREVQEDDHGVYMCQVNTDPMIAEMAYLEVVVPPQIDDEESSAGTEVEEGASVSLFCKAKGHPNPNVSWQREGGAKIALRDHGPAKKVGKVEGEVLNLTKVKRSDMGPYLCIAKNGIPPSVSKRIFLSINFKPVMEIPLHMVGSPLGDDVTISCKVESSPKAANTWKKFPGDQMIITSGKYSVTEEHQGYYTSVMTLSIRNFTTTDATNYVCSSSNSLGYSESTIQVYEIPTSKVQKEGNELDDSEDESLTKGSRTKDSNKDSAGLHSDKNRLDNHLNTYPSGAKKGLSSTGSDGGRTRENDPRNDKSTGSAEEGIRPVNEVSEGGGGGGGGFTFFGSGAQGTLIHITESLFSTSLLMMVVSATFHLLLHIVCDL